MTDQSDRADAADVRALYQLFLGREPEFDPAAKSSDAGFLNWTSSVVRSEEFVCNVWRPLTAGCAPLAPLFVGQPSTNLPQWAAERLPLSDLGRRKVAGANSWYALYDFIFGDAVFRARIVGDIPMPVGLTDRVHVADIRAIYRLFLGREPEFDPSTVPLPAVSLIALIRAFLHSAEFADSIQPVILIASGEVNYLFESSKTEALRDWAASRLPLSPPTRARLGGIDSWRMLLSAVLSDRTFLDRIAASYIPVDEQSSLAIPLNVQELIVIASRLLDRDWYLATYGRVAVAGADPTQHHLLHGVAEATDPNRLFNTLWYLSAYPQARLRDVCPLVHYIIEGAKLGYRPHPFFPLMLPANAGAEDATPLARFLYDIVPLDAAAFPRFTAYDVHEATRLNYRRLAAPATIEHINLMVFRPSFVVLIDDASGPGVRETRASLKKQLYSDFTIASSISEVKKIARTTRPTTCYLLWLAPGDELADHALYEVAAWLNRKPDDELVYFDHVQASPGSSELPFYKPDWSPDYLEGFNYIGNAACFELCRAAQLLTECETVYDLVLRFTEATDRVSHLPKLLLTSKGDPMQVAPAQQAKEMQALEGRLGRTGRAGMVEPLLAGAGCYNVTIALRREPLVSAVIPTAARTITYEGETIDLIVNCLETIVALSDYENVEFIVVDNGDLDRERLCNVPQSRLRFVTYHSPEINIAAKINLGASLAAGELLLILNDDIVPLRPDWIRRMVAHFEKPHVGLVGAKLLYPTHLVQHAGIVLCDGLPEHVNRLRPDNDPGYFFSSIVPRNYSAVTGAVEMVSRELFCEIGGYDERLPIDFNDVDFACSIGRTGHSIVLEPAAKLIHYESVSAVKPPRPWDFDLFTRKWAEIATDPFFNEYSFAKHPAAFDIVYSERRH